MPDHTITPRPSSTPDTPCECRVCGRHLVVSFMYCTFHGWPRCCGRQVRMLSTTCDIDKGMGEALAPVTEAIARAKRGETPR